MIISANFKTNHTRASTKEYIDKLNLFLNSNDVKNEVTLFIPSTTFNNFNSKANIGTQNAYPTKSGSFTGEIGLEQLSEFNIKTILIGHSERRHILKESNEFILQKFNFFKEQGFKIFYCIGEPLDIRKKGLGATLGYIDSQLEGIDLNYSNLVVAYEPVWAIGTGITATTDEIEETCSKLKERFDKPLLYGGSVKVANTKEILSLNSVDGVLVGTTSWKVDEFIEMIKEGE